MTVDLRFYAVPCPDCHDGIVPLQGNSRLVEDCSTCDGYGFIVEQVEVVEPIRDVQFRYFKIGKEI